MDPVIDNFDPGATPTALAINSATQRLYVGGPVAMEVVDTGSGTVVAHVASGFVVAAVLPLSFPWWPMWRILGQPRLFRGVRGSPFEQARPARGDSVSLKTVSSSRVSLFHILPNPYRSHGPNFNVTSLAYPTEYKRRKDSG